MRLKRVITFKNRNQVVKNLTSSNDRPTNVSHILTLFMASGLCAVLHASKITVLWWL
jgi:hypothetical protein